MKNTKIMMFLLMLAILASPAAFAKKDGGPAGWMKGEKKGWNEGSQPPGLSKKDAEKAEKEAKKKAKEAEKEKKKAEKEAAKKAKEAEKEAKKKAEEAKKALQS